MRKQLLIATAALALTGLAACAARESDGAVSPGGPSDSPTAVENTASEQATESAASEDIDPLLAEVVGTWTSDDEGLGPNGSAFTVNEDGTAEYSNEEGTYEGEVTLGDAAGHTFNGTLSDTGTAIEIGFQLDGSRSDILLIGWVGSDEIYEYHRE
jgi:hypothetical protein